MFLAPLLLIATALTPPQEPKASWMPPGAALHVEFSAEPFTRSGSGLALVKMWNEPEFVEFTSGLRPMAEMGIQAAKMQLGAFGLPPNTLELLSHGSFSLSLYDVQVETSIPHYEVEGEEYTYQSRDAVPDMVMVAENRGEPGLISDVMDALEGMLGMQEDVAVERIMIEGHEVARLHDASGGTDFEILLVIEPDRLIAATSRDRLAATLQRMAGAEVPSLTSDAGFAEGWGRAHRADTVLFAHIDLPALIKLIVNASGEDDIAQITGMIPYKSFTYGLGLDGAGLREHMLMRGVPGHPLSSMIDLAPGKTRTPAMVPSGAAMVSATRYRFADMIESLMGLLVQVEPNAAQDIERTMAHFDQVGGMSFRDEFLPALGHEIGTFLTFPGRALLPEVGVLVELADSGKVKTFVENVVRNLQGARPKSVRFGAHTIHYVELGDIDMGDFEATMRPSWAFLGDHLVVGLWPQTVKSVLARHDENGPSVLDDPGFAATAKAFPHGMAATSTMSYMDLRAGFEFLLDNGIPVAQSLAPSMQGVPLDLAGLPRTQTLAKHMFGMMAVSEPLESGIYTEVYSPTSILLPYGMLIGAGLAAFRIEAQMPAIIYDLDAEGPLPLDSEKF